MRRVAIAVAVMGLSLASCGGGDADGGPPSDAVRRVEAVEFSFTPDSWVGEAGATLMLDFTNAGSIDHNWVVLSQAVESEDEITDVIKLFTVTASAGETVSTPLPSLDAGTYQVVCDIAGHLSAGMEGELRLSG